MLSHASRSVTSSTARRTEEYQAGSKGLVKVMASRIVSLRSQASCEQYAVRQLGALICPFWRSTSPRQACRRLDLPCEKR